MENRLIIWTEVELVLPDVVLEKLIPGKPIRVDDNEFSICEVNGQDYLAIGLEDNDSDRTQENDGND